MHHQRKRNCRQDGGAATAAFRGHRSSQRPLFARSMSGQW
jgi:hypothetical protein